MKSTTDKYTAYVLWYDEAKRAHAAILRRNVTLARIERLKANLLTWSDPNLRSATVVIIPQAQAMYLRPSEVWEMTGGAK